MESPESLLEHATWLRRLAASLVQRDADDIAQDAWLAAVTHPPAAERPVRPWLARVVRNAVRFRWRSDTNRARREAVVAAAAADDAAPTSEDLLARHQLQRLLAKLVAELAEPYRSTILLRYGEGLEPSEIAKRLGVPASTVRGRVRDALEKLRCGLDDANGGDRKKWLLALGPLALWPRAAKAGIAPVVAAIAAAVLALAAIGISTSSVDSAEVERSGSVPSSMPATASKTATAPIASWLVQPSAPARHLAGRVVRDGAPVAGANVRLVSDDAEPVEVRSDGAGRFDFGEQVAREVSLGAAANDALAAIRHFDLRDPTAASDDVELELSSCSAWLAGYVTDAAGTPIPHANVLREDTIGTETDARGAYELCTLPTAAWVHQLDVVVRADGYGPVVAGVAPAGRIDRDFVLAPEATITGVAAPNASVWMEPDRDIAWRTGERPAREVAQADADGQFRIVAAGGRYRIGAAARGEIAVAQLVSVEPAATANVALRMTPAATVHGRVVMRGVPVAGARVAVQHDRRVVVGHDDPADDVVSVSSAVTQADGTFVLDGVSPGTTAFTATPVHVTSPPSALVAGDNLVELQAEPLGAIRGVVRRHGAPVPFARVSIGGGPTPMGVTADATGGFDATGLEPGTYGFYADDSRRGAYFVDGGLVVRAGEVVDHDIELAWGARISGVVVDTARAPVANVGVRFHAADGGEARCTTDAAGSFACGSLDGGKPYTAIVSPGDRATRPFALTSVASIDVPADGTVDGVVLVVDPRTTSIAGTVIDDTGAPVADVRIRLTGDGIDYSGWLAVPTAVSDANGSFHFDRLPPGDYELLVDGDRGTADTVVAAGATTAVVTLSRARCDGVAAAPQLAHVPATPMIWDDRIELVGWNLPSTARVGEPIEVTLAFRARASIVHPWTLFAHFDSPIGGHRRNADHTPVGESCRTSSWQVGQIYVDHFTTTLAYAEPYTLRLGFFRFGDGDEPMQNLAATAGSALTGVELGTVTVASSR